MFVNCKMAKKQLGGLPEMGDFEDTRNFCEVVEMYLRLGELLEGADWSSEE